MPELIRRCIEPLESRHLLASVPSGFTDSIVASGLISPTAMAVAPDGRIFVAQQGGGIRIVKNNSLLSTPFYTLPHVNSDVERGFLGIVVDPNYESNHYIYTYATTDENGLHNRIARLTADGDVAATNSYTDLVDLPPINGAIWHMGGSMHFGPDGKLYVGVGDHQYFDQNALQSITVPFGKLLRFNADGSIPTDNPFYNQATGLNRAIWAMGLRNPYTFDIQPGTGKLFINDVGQEAFEEIDYAQAGLNFGWPATEGNFNQSSFPNFTEPFLAYPQTAPECAIIGSLFYDPAVQQFPSNYVGQYLFADLCEGTIRMIDPNDASKISVFATGLQSPVDFDLAPDGSIFYLQRTGNVNNGQVGRISFPAGVVEQAQITSQPQNQEVFAGESATFDVAATGQGLTFQWLKDDKTISGATASSYTIDKVEDDDAGAYRVRVTNNAGSLLSDEAQLTVEANSSPIAKILTPVVGTKYQAGQIITLDGRGNDAEDGSLKGDAFTWQVDFHTGTVVRPFIAPTDGTRKLKITLPTTSVFTEANVFYRIFMTVADSNGATSTVHRDIKPVTAKVKVTSNLSGVTLFVDEQPKASPTTFTGVAGIVREIGANEQVTVKGKAYVFDSWSDGGELQHPISTPAVNTTFTANYRLLGVSGSTQTLAPRADAFVFQGAPGTNFGDDPNLLVKTDDIYQRDTYIKFNLSGIDGPVQSAKLRIFARLSAATARNLALGIYYAAGAKWDSNSITYHNRRKHSSIAAATAIVNDDSAQWYNLDLTSLINAELAKGRKVLTFVLHNLNANAIGTVINSSRSASNKPELQIIA